MTREERDEDLQGADKMEAAARGNGPIAESARRVAERRRRWNATVQVAEERAEALAGLLLEARGWLALHEFNAGPLIERIDALDLATDDVARGDQ